MMDPGKDITPGRMAQDQRGEGIGECPRVRRGAVMGDLIAITEECHHKGSRNNVLSLKTIEIFLLIFLLTIHPRIHHMVVDKECITEIEDEAPLPSPISLQTPLSRSSDERADHAAADSPAVSD